MPYGVHKHSKTIIIANYKVMFSTLFRAGSPVEPISARAIFKYPAFRRFLIVRNPYDRSTSFYRNWFITVFKNTEWVARESFAPHQKMFFPHLGLQDSDSFKRKMKRFEEVTFEKYVQVLPFVFKMNGHTAPQVEILRPALLNRLPSLKIPINVDQIVRLEDSDAVRTFGRRIGIDTDKRVLNSTSSLGLSSQHLLEQAGPTAISTLNEIYKEDFTRFNYPSF